MFGLLWLFTREKEIKLIIPIEKNYQTIVLPQNQIDKINSPILSPSSNSSKDNVSNLNNEKTIVVKLIVLEKAYQSNIKEGTNLLELMEILVEKNKSDFSFKYKKYPGVGIFINEINGQSDGPGNYWLYYINGVESSVGASDYQLKPEDMIEWRLE